MCLFYQSCGIIAISIISLYILWIGTYGVHRLIALHEVYEIESTQNTLTEGCIAVLFNLFVFFINYYINYSATDYLYEYFS